MSCATSATLLISGLLYFFACCDIRPVESHGVHRDENAATGGGGFFQCEPTVDTSNACYVPCSSRDFDNGNCSFLVRGVFGQGGPTFLSKLSSVDVWLYSMASAFLISLSGLWGYLFLPLMTGPYRNHVLNVLIGISFGSIVTSALCQLIPEAYELGRLMPNSNDYVFVAAISMTGLWLTWFLQGVASIIGKDYSEATSKVNIDHKLKNLNNVVERTNNGMSMYTFPCDVEHVRQAIPGEITRSHGDFPSALKRRANSVASYASLKKSKPKLTKLAIVILVGDFLNNFMDGISIGAGYSFYLSTGIKLTSAIAFEEYTHKLGDFAIVFQCGVSIRRVLFLNYITSCACFIGVAIGIGLGNLQWSQYIFAFASGLFLVIALSNMIPEMQNMLEERLEEGRMSGCIALFEQHLGFFFASILLIVISVILNSKSLATIFNR